MAIEVYDFYAAEENPEGHIVDVVRCGTSTRFTHVATHGEALEQALEHVRRRGDWRIVAVIPIGWRGDRFRVIAESVGGRELL